MKSLILSLAIVATLAMPQPQLREQWNQFKLLHKKEYSNPLEEVRRMAIFNENLNNIQQHNARYKKGEVTYTKKMNHFGDMTNEEFLEYVNRGRATRPKKNEKLSLPWEPSMKPTAALVDWRRSAVTPVKNQGKCGSCWSFSATGALEGQLALHTGTLISLSEQNLIDCSTYYGTQACNGGWMDSAFQYIYDYGIMTERAYPYEAQLDYCRFDYRQSVTSIRGYYDLPSGSESSLADAVANYGPVAVAIEATDELQFYYSGIIYDRTCGQNLNHGVLVVGYGSEGGYDYWIVKNSWGTGWGEAGFYRAIRNYGNNCGIASVASFPVL